MKPDMQMRRFAELIARKQGWSLNPDNDFLTDLLDGLAKNNERYGFFLCPCRDSWADRDKDKDIKCPCAYAREDIEEYNKCFCGLFVKSHVDENDLSDYVPDRRPDELYPE